MSHGHNASPGWAHGSIFGAVALALLMLPTAGCQRSSPQLRVLSQTSDRVFVGGEDAYYLTCLSDIRLFVADSSEERQGRWKSVRTSLPGKGAYYLDGRFPGYSMCDVAVCTKLDSLGMSLVRYEETGRQPLPSGRDTVPAFQSVPLRGKIKIEIETYPTSACQNKQVSEVTLNR